MCGNDQNHTMANIHLPQQYKVIKKFAEFKSNQIKSVRPSVYPVRHAFSRREKIKRRSSYAIKQVRSDNDASELAFLTKFLYMHLFLLPSLDLRNNVVDWFLREQEANC